MRFRLHLLVAVALLAGGCVGQRVPVSFWPPDAPVLPLLGGDEEGTPAAPEWRQYVVLLPDEDGTVGEIEVSRDGESVTLDEAYQAVDFNRLDAPTVLVHDEVASSFETTIGHEPPAPESFTLFFELDSTRRSAESEGQLESLVAAVLARTAPTVILHGHADRSGSEESNMALSRARAEEVRDLLVASGVDEDVFRLHWFGETRPAVATDDGVREVRNRRVGIRVR